MTDQNKIKALAELDGWEWYKYIPSGIPYAVRDLKADGVKYLSDFENLLASYDAIIPLIQKQDEKTKRLFIGRLDFIKAKHFPWDATPHQLADALLVATGKMKGQK